MYQPIDTTLAAPVSALDNKGTIPAGTPVRFAVDGDTVLVRASDGRGAKMPLALAQVCLAAMVIAAPAVTVDDLLDAPMAPSRIVSTDATPVAAPRVSSLPSHRARKATDEQHVVLHADLRHATNAAEMCEMVGLDWTVSTCDLQTVDGRASSAKSLRRSDTGAELDVVSGRYSVIQNADAFGVLDPIVAEGCPFVGAGWFNDGRKVYAQVDLSTRSEIVPGDSVQHYLHVRSGHESGVGMSVVRSDVRIVCRNTLARATSTGAKLFKVRHIGDTAAKVLDVREALEAMRAEIDRDVAMYRMLAARKFSTDDVRSVMDSILGTKEQRARETWRNEAQKALTDMWSTGRAIGANLAGATAWGALNLVTQYTTHTMAKRTDAPQLAVIDGEAARMNDRALEKILVMVEDRTN